MKRRFLLTSFAAMCWLPACRSGGIGVDGNLNQRQLNALAGARAAKRVEPQYGGVCRDAQVECRMQHIGRKLMCAAPQLQGVCTYRLLNSDDANALSLPLGRIYITKGLYDRIDNRENVLAAVLAHEMAHLLSGDSLKPSPCNCAAALQREIDADSRAADLLRQAGFDPQSLVAAVELVRYEQPATWADQRVTKLRAGRDNLLASAR